MLPDTDEQAIQTPAPLLKNPYETQAPVQAVDKLPQEVHTLFKIPYPARQLMVPAPATQVNEVELHEPQAPAPLT